MTMSALYEDLSSSITTVPSTQHRVNVQHYGIMPDHGAPHDGGGHHMVDQQDGVERI